MKKGQVFIGTSGFSYSHWGKGIFYPKGLPQKDWFEYYCQHFKTVELNVSFYRLPKKETFAKWREKAGPKFTFAIKGSRYITHIKRLKDCQEPVERFLGNAEALKFSAETRKGIGDAKAIITQNAKRKTQNVILWQLPPRFKLSSNQAIKRLSDFLDILPKDFRQAFEFRDESWVDKRVYKVLKKYKVAMVFQDFPDWPVTEELTADFVYLRFHGRTHLYTSGYSKKELETWAEKIKKWRKKGLDIYAYFNNDALGYAVENAIALKALVLQ